jgi:hypothetical protein
MPTCKRILSAWGVALLLATGASVAGAANLGFLRDTPISRMTQADFDSLTTAVRAAVDEKQDGESTTWTNEGRRNSARVEATITATKTDKDGDRTCRAMEVVISARQQSMTLRPRFCREGAGAWVYQQTH